MTQPPEAPAPEIPTPEPVHILGNYVALQITAKLSAWLVEDPTRMSQEEHLRQAMCDHFRATGEVPEVEAVLATPGS